MSSFYIGYLPKAPDDLRRFIRRIVAFVIILAALMAAALAVAQHRFDTAFFEFTHIRDFEGTLEAKPYPTLLVRRPGSLSDQQQFSRYLLVGVGKQGAESEVSVGDGVPVHFRGKLIYRGGQTMIEVMPGSMQALAAGAISRPPADLGPVVTLHGEIVDSKCHTGVMNPGRGKVHRDCAVRCLSGGVPPVLVESDPPYRLILLSDAEGNKLVPARFLDRVAEPISVRGRLVTRGERQELWVEKIQ